MNLPKNIPPELRAHGSARSQRVVDDIKKAMKAIELDIEANDGIYPYNKGSVCVAEVCRRAGRSEAILEGYAHKETTKALVNTWLAGVKGGIASGAKSVRKKVTDRNEILKAKLAATRNAYYLDQVRFEQAKSRIKILESENDELRLRLNQSAQGSVRYLPQDGSRIFINDEANMTYWATELKVEVSELLGAVERVGTSILSIRDFLQR